MKTITAIFRFSCYWGYKDLSYEDFALGLRSALQKDKSALDAGRLQKFTGPQLRELLKWPRPLPLEDERIRLLHEVGCELEISFGGKASNLVESCGNSAVKLVTLIARHFPGQGFGQSKDIASITIFADYIVPAVLHHLGVLRYGFSVASIIKNDNEIGSGSEEEVELRVCSIYAVEKMRELIKIKTGKQALSVELDLWLWSYGIQCHSLQHHRTLSIYY
ncbi:Queuosine salvage protein family [Dillenia turbinata]|uniref:Queuosine 5'-phosphate N-glycosylase/hydrolase n=1 Tax=Dillenia turbinata TaxID=194707 RepID=A0AAN8UWE6_9MAGN